jgi:hypothetical protein
MNKKLHWALSFGALTFAAVTLLSTAVPAQVARAQDPDEGAAAVVAWDTDGNSVNKKAFLGSTNNKPLILKTNNVERVRIDKDGKVGIGTTKPQQSLHIAGANTRQRLESSAKNVWTAVEYKADSREWHTGVGGSEVPNDLKAKFYVHDMTSGNTRMVIDQNGRVGVGTTSPAATLEVAVGGMRLSEPNGYGDIEFTETADVVGFITTDDPNPDAAAFRVGSGKNPVARFTVRNDGIAQLGALADATTKHVCINNDLMLANCSSSAEYVPVIDSVGGYPRTGDLVSIAPATANPYGDKHGPFAVEKSSKACDDNLLGFIVNPKLGANGVKLNNHYLPLAIYGYFPAKVTAENGPIKRGDPITSSSKAGYGMKATGACKIIGYALEDAPTGGVIQVFADLGDNSAARVKALEQENQGLHAQLTALESRLLALEVSTPPSTAPIR